MSVQANTPNQPYRPPKSTVENIPPADGRAVRPVYETVRLIARLIIPLICRLRTEGLANIPASGPVILATNHIHWTDIPLGVVRVPRIVHFMSKIENFRVPVLGRILRWCGTFSVRRGEGDREALRTAERLLHDGEVIVIFPEGHRSGTGVLLPAHSGAAYVALRSGAPIVPIGISGTQQVFKSWRLGPWAPRVTIRYGRPFQLDVPTDGKRDRDTLAHATDQLMRQIAALLPPEQRGPYADAVPPATSTP